MDKNIDHLPEQKQNELRRIAETICNHCNCVEMVILFGSYARGDWKDGPHEQGRGKLVIHKKSDYDILVVTLSDLVARDASLWQDIKEQCEREGLSTYLRIIPRDIEFLNDKLREGQYFFTEIVQQGKMLYDSGNYKLDTRKPLDPEQEKRYAQHYFDEVFTLGKEFYDTFNYDYRKERYKKAAFELNQACEHAYKTILLTFGGECPQENHLDILGDLAADYCPSIAGLLPRETEQEKELFELLDYAYIGARYDFRYKINKQQLDQLTPGVEKLHEVIEQACKEKIESLG